MTNHDKETEMDLSVSAIKDVEVVRAGLRNSMKANQLIKDFGLQFAKDTLNVCSSKTIHINDDGKEYLFDRDELSRLIESHDLVDFYDGIDGAKQALKTMHFDVYAKAHLKQAITDYEACQ